MNNEEIAHRLKSVRADSGLSQDDFAAQLGISLRAYQTYERGERELSLGALDRLFAVFRINPVWLLQGDGAAPRRLLTLDALAALMVDLHRAFEKPIALSGQPTSYGERAVGWSYLVRESLLRGTVDQETVDRMHKVILTG